MQHKMVELATPVGMYCVHRVVRRLVTTRFYEYVLMKDVISAEFTMDIGILFAFFKIDLFIS